MKWVMASVVLLTTAAVAQSTKSLTLREAIELGKEHNKLLQVSLAKVEAAGMNVTAVRGAWWPQLFLTGNYYFSRPNQRYLPTVDEFRSSWDVGIQLKVDVWNWRVTSYQTDQAEAALKQQELMYDKMRDDAAMEVQKFQLLALRNSKKVVVAQLALEQAEENIRTTNNKYKNGLATSSELLDANAEMLQTRLNLTDAQIDKELALAKLKRALGFIE